MKTEEIIQDKIELYKKSIRECLEVWDLEKAGRYNERLTALEWVLEE